MPADACAGRVSDTEHVLQHTGQTGLTRLSGTLPFVVLRPPVPTTDDFGYIGAEHGTLISGKPSCLASPHGSLSLSQICNAALRAYNDEDSTPAAGDQAGSAQQGYHLVRVRHMLLY